MKLRDKINEKCYSITQLANKSKVKRQTIYRLLDGNKAHDYTWAKLAKALRCKIEDIKED